VLQALVRFVISQFPVAAFIKFPTASIRAQNTLGRPTRICVHLSHESGFRVFCELS